MKPALTLLTALLLAPPAALHAQEASWPARERPDLKFSFDAPAGAQFAEAEKNAQCGHGKEVMPRVRKAFDACADSVTIPPGDYRFERGSWDEDGKMGSVWNGTELSWYSDEKSLRI